MMNTEQRGSTLLLVTWLLAIMALVATFLIYRSEAEWAIVLNTEENAKARQIAEQVLYQQLTVLLADEKEHDVPSEKWFGKTGRFTLDKKKNNGYDVTVLVEDEGSKPNINMLGTPALLELIPLKEWEKNPVDALVDWIDPDGDVREKGAEDEYYKALKPGYKPRNGFLSSIQEILAVKGGKNLLKYYGQELSVYGKINLNTLDKEKFAFILKLAGVDNGLNNIVQEFENFKVMQNGRFNTIKDVEKLNGVMLGTADKLKPFFDITNDEEVFTGACNINLVSEKGLKVVLRNAGMSPRMVIVNKIMEKRKEEPIKDLNELKELLGFSSQEKTKFNVEDYFTLDSSVFRYQIWVSKGNQKYYLNTVQKRIVGDLRRKWKIATLYWQALSNNSVPPIPKLTPFEATLITKSKKEKELEQKKDDELEPQMPEPPPGEVPPPPPTEGEQMTPGPEGTTGGDTQNPATNEESGVTPIPGEGGAPNNTDNNPGTDLNGNPPSQDDIDAKMRDDVRKAKAI